MSWWCICVGGGWSLFVCCLLFVFTVFFGHGHGESTGQLSPR